MLKMINVTYTHAKGTPLETAALRNVSISLQPGDFACIVGPNGSGKSSLLNLVAGVAHPERGTIMIEGQDVTHLAQHKRAASIGLVFQNPLQGTAPGMTVEENLSLALLKGKPYGLGWLIASSRRRFLRESLADLGLGLEERLYSKVGVLSGGQRQALTLLMATLTRPSILLLDEHTAALDPATAARVIKISQDLISEHRLTTIMVSHNLDQAVTLGNRLIMLRAGEVVMDLSEKEKANLTVGQLRQEFF